MYPNPTKGRKINIQIGRGIKLEKLSLYDILGKEKELPLDVLIDLDGVESGVYILKIETNQGVLQKKVIVE